MVTSHLTNHRHSFSKASLLLSTLLLFGCESQENVQPSSLESTAQLVQEKNATATHYGPATAFLGGTARAYVEVIHGKPSSIGLELSAAVMQNMPQDMVEITLKLPGQAHATGIKTLAVGWNHEGHVPENIYDVPHFDFHFYNITEGQLKQIKGGIDEEAFKLLSTFPEQYELEFGVPFSVPNMGVHWIDNTAPEWTGGSFSKTFIYGSHKDKVTFLEPMITLDYFLGLTPDIPVVSPIYSLLKHATPGYYPASYTIEYNASEEVYTVALTDLAFRNINK